MSKLFGLNFLMRVSSARAAKKGDPLSVIADICNTSRSTKEALEKMDVVSDSVVRKNIGQFLVSTAFSTFVACVGFTHLTVAPWYICGFLAFLGIVMFAQAATEMTAKSVHLIYLNEVLLHKLALMELKNSLVEVDVDTYREAINDALENIQHDFKPYLEKEGK